jgi:hypothetical protein
MNRDSWNERPVTFAEFSIREGKPMLAAFERDGEEGSFALLVLSLRYADTGEAVFISVDEIMNQPFRLRERLSHLAGRCAFTNGLRATDPSADVAVQAHSNGHAEGELAGPSH